MPDKWTAADIPDQSGRTAVVTGANSGLGLATARELARTGARVVMACRNAERAESALAELRARVPEADASLATLDLADLASVRAFALEFCAGHERLDLLINNAGLMAPPRGVTKDGFELQFGVNHLGHYALTGLLLERLLAAPAARVVTLSSAAHRTGRINFSDPQSERHYVRWLAYGQSKLANLLFALELERRASAAGLELRSMAAHPGYAATNLQFASPPLAERIVFGLSNRVFAQSADMGALPSLYAATVEDLPGGTFVGPDGLFEGRGHPHPVLGKGSAYDESTAARLWELSAELTGVTYEFVAPVGT